MYNSNGIPCVGCATTEIVMLCWRCGMGLCNNCKKYSNVVKKMCNDCITLVELKKVHYNQRVEKDKETGEFMVGGRPVEEYYQFPIDVYSIAEHCVLCNKRYNSESLQNCKNCKRSFCNQCQGVDEEDFCDHCDKKKCDDEMRKNGEISDDPESVHDFPKDLSLLDDTDDHYISWDDEEEKPKERYDDGIQGCILDPCHEERYDPPPEDDWSGDYLF